MVESSSSSAEEAVESSSSLVSLSSSPSSESSVIRKSSGRMVVMEGSSSPLPTLACSSRSLILSFSAESRLDSDSVWKRMEGGGGWAGSGCLGTAAGLPPPLRGLCGKDLTMSRGGSVLMMSSGSSWSLTIGCLPSFLLFLATLTLSPLLLFLFLCDLTTSCGRCFWGFLPRLTLGCCCCCCCCAEDGLKWTTFAFAGASPLALDLTSRGGGGA